MKSLIRKWLGIYNGDEVAIATPIRNSEPSIRIGIIPAMNGRALEIGKKVPGRHGDFDWQYSMFLVPDDIPLSEALTTFLLLEGLK